MHFFVCLRFDAILISSYHGGHLTYSHLVLDAEPNRSFPSANTCASNSLPSIFVWKVELSDHRHNFMTIYRSTAQVICANSRSHEHWDSQADI